VTIEVRSFWVHEKVEYLLLKEKDMCSKEQGYYMSDSDRYKNYRAKRGVEGEVVGHVADTKPSLTENVVSESWDGGKTWKAIGEYQMRDGAWVLVRCDSGDLMRGGLS
jgi:hypothetical protein